MPFGLGNKEEKLAKKAAEERSAALLAARWAQVNRKPLHEKAIKAIDAAVGEDEQVLAIVPGLSDQAIVATTKRIYVYKKGGIAGVSGGEKLTTWEFRAIHGVQMELGRLTGYVSLQTPGSQTVDTSYWSNDANGPAKSANAIPIGKDKKNPPADAVKRLREVIDQYSGH